MTEEKLKVVGLLSGGKDSCYNLCHCAQQGYEIVALATLAPPKGKDELDSYMYQTVGHDAVHLVAQAMGLPLYRSTISGRAINQTSSYGSRLPYKGGEGSNHGDETEDLYRLLRKVKEAHPEINAVSVGAILSNYQRVRVEQVALRSDLRLLPLAFLWQRHQAELLDEMCRADLEAILIKVAGIGLEQEDLGKSLKCMRPKLNKLNAMYGAHVCGEGGEYETLTIDGPLFQSKILLDQTEEVVHSESSFASVSYMRIGVGRLEGKEGTTQQRLHSVTIPPTLDRVGRRTKRASKEARVSSTPTSSAQLADSSEAPLSSPSLSACKRGPWLAVGNVAASKSGRNASPQAEFQEAFKTLQDTLEAHSLSMAHLCHINVYLSCQSLFPDLNKVYSSHFGVDPPSRACIAFSNDEKGESPRVILEALALDDGSRYDREGKVNAGGLVLERGRKALHVQGRSYWAAANIGPYSQAVNAMSRISIAGQIGLLPATLELESDEDTQIALSLQHARRVYKAVLESRAESSRHRGWIEGCLCWLDGGGNVGARMKAVKRAWEVQAPNDDDEEEEEEEEEEGEPQWEDRWLGEGVSALQVPLAIIVLSADALPKKAAVEWQLSAHDGKHVGKDDINNEDEEEEEEGEAGLATYQHGTCVFSDFKGQFVKVSSKRGASSFGIAYLTRGSIEALPLEEMLQGALLVRIFSQSTLRNSYPNYQETMSHFDPCPPITLLPVQALFDGQGKAWELVIVWQGTI